MKSIEQMKQDIKNLMNQLGDMRAKCISEKRDPTGDEVIMANDCLDKVKDLERLVLLEDNIASTQERLAKPVASKTLENTNLSKDSKEIDKRSRFSTLGEQLMATKIAGSPGGYVDTRLRTSYASESRTAEATGLNVQTSSDGGFLIQQEFSNELLGTLFQTGLLLPRCRVIEIGPGKNGVMINGFDETSRATGSRWGGVIAYWENEAGSKPATKPKFRQIDLKLKKLVGLCYATDEVLEDSVVLESWIKTAFNDEFNFQIDDAIINGTGAGVPLGIINSGCLVSVAKETGQKATTIYYDNIVNMWARLIAKSRLNAVWLINQDCEPQLQKMSLPVGTGGVPVYLPPGGASVSPYSMLYGRPVIPIEQCQTLGTEGDIILADFKEYIIARKGGLKTDVSIHVRFQYDELVFRFVLRIDGQPIRASAITPYKGSNELSSFVTLAVRA